MRIIIIFLVLLFYAPLLLVIIALAIRYYINRTYKDVDKQLRIFGFVVDYMFRFNNIKTVNKLRFYLSKIKLFPSNKSVFEEMLIKTSEDKSLRIITLKSKDTSPNATGLLWIHGGGMALKRPESETPYMEQFVANTNTVILSPDYTLSPIAPYPAALNDCYEALLYMKNNAKELGINENQIFVGGTSAGGGLTAALTMMARDKGEINIAFQMPLYPMVNYKTVPQAGEKSKKTYVWDLKRNLIAWKLYLGTLYGTENIPEYASPLQANNFENLPPAYTFVGEQDPFFEDTLQYAKKLSEAGVKVEYNVYKGAYHGFEGSCPKADISKTAQSELINAFEYAIKNYFKAQN